MIDNLSTVPVVIALALLAWSDNRLLHRTLVPLCFVMAALDTLAISYLIE